MNLNHNPCKIKFSSSSSLSLSVGVDVGGQGQMGQTGQNEGVILKDAFPNRIFAFRLYG